MLDAALQFILECDKLKAIERRSKPVGMSRRENSAEHSWSLALAAMTLAPEIDPNLDLLRILKMLVLHDIVEIDAGDIFCYADQTDKAALETAAADRIFNILPNERAEEFLALWREFEAAITPEARFANAMDRLLPLFQNHANGGGSWKEHNIRVSQVLQRAAGIETVSPELWGKVLGLIESASESGWLLKTDPQQIEA